MKALIYLGPGKYVWKDKEKPSVQLPTDAVVKISRTTICGTDLHILKGDLPTVEPGRTLSHEGVGVIVEKGEDVANFAVGDRVLISCITSCGRCGYCRRQMYPHCEHGGWILGNRIDGAQAEYVRIPFADTLLKAAASGAIDPKKMITHRFGLSEMLKAYDTFGHAGRERALKVVLSDGQ